MLHYMKRHFKLVTLVLILSIFSKVLIPISAVLEQKLFDYVIQGDFSSFLNILWPVLAVVLLSVSTYFLNAIALNKLKKRCTEDLRNDLFVSIMHRDITRFYEKDTAEYSSYILNDVNTVIQNSTSPIFSLVGAGFSAVVSVIVMVIYSPVLALVAVICSFLSFWGPILITKNLKEQLIKKSISNAEMSIDLKESLNGYAVVSAYGVFSTVHNKFKSSNSLLEKVNYKVAKLVSLLENCAIVTGKVARFITLIVSGFMAVQGQISIGTVFLFVSLYEYFNCDVVLFSQCIPILKSSKPTTEKLLAIVEEKTRPTKNYACPKFSSEIHVENLHFQYDQDIPVLQELSFSIRKGEKIALVGPSGCGKSTLVKLISGNYENYNGGIYFDKVELRKLDQRQIRKIVAVIQQQTYLFNDSIRNNICLGEDFTESALQRALSLSGVEQFLPDITGGLNGNCGEDGINLSGGQKQRVALARALIRGIDFLILDEGTSAIDVNTANRIEAELLNMRGLTLLTITHRIKDSLLDKYDAVLVMDGGKISERRQNI